MWTRMMQLEAYFHVKNDTNTNVFIQLRRQRAPLKRTLWTGPPFLCHGTGTFQIRELDCLHSLVRCLLKLSDFWVKLKDCFAYACRHGTWNSLGRTSTWAIFPRSVVLTIDWEESDWPTATTELLRVVNNSDNMNEEVWEWREASHQALDYCTVSLAAGWHCESIQRSVYETVNGPLRPTKPIRISQIKIIFKKIHR